jgi:predicted XRE-type DNA-binding protein
VHPGRRPDRELQKLLANELCRIIEGDTLEEAMYTLGLDPPRISELRHGQLARFSIGRLVRLFAQARYDVEVSIRPTEPPQQTFIQPRVNVVRYDRFDRPQ